MKSLMHLACMVCGMRHITLTVKWMRGERPRCDRCHHPMVPHTER